MKTALLKLLGTICAGVGLFIADKHYSGQAKEFTIYAMGYAVCVGIVIGFLSGFLQRKSKEGK